MYSWLSYRVCMVYTRELDWIQVSIQGKKTFFHTLLCVKESCYYWIIKVYLIKEQLNLFVNKMNSNVDISKTFFVSKSRILSPNSSLSTGRITVLRCFHLFDLFCKWGFFLHHAGHILDLYWIWLSNTAIFCENYTKL